MKALVIMPTTIVDEPDQEDNFITGYQTLGDTFNGSVEIIQNANVNTINGVRNIYAYAYQNNFEIIYGPSSYISNQYIMTIAEEYYLKGIQSIFPAGSNTLTAGVTNYTGNIILTGAGVEENQTGYYIDFFDIDPKAGDRDILQITQEGTQYGISQIQRLTGNHLGIKLSASAGSVTALGITDHGIPMMIIGLSSAATSTNISFASLTGNFANSSPGRPVYYTGWVQPNGTYFYINDIVTTAGTYNTWQSLTGASIIFGDDLDDNQVATSSTTASLKTFIRIDRYLYGYNQWGVYFSGVTGFQNNLQGVKAYNQMVNGDGFGDKLDVVWTSGTGSYAGGAKLQLHTSSNSLPFIAGKLALIKERCNCSWREARIRMQNTASRASNYTVYSGYGRPDVWSAIYNSNYDSFMLRPQISISESNLLYTITWGYDPAPDYYEIWFRNSLSGTVVGSSTSFTYRPSSRISVIERNQFKIRPVREPNNYGQFSNTVEATYYFGQYIHKRDIPLIDIPGYGDEYGEYYG